VESQIVRYPYVKLTQKKTKNKTKQKKKTNVYVLHAFRDQVQTRNIKQEMMVKAILTMSCRDGARNFYRQGPMAKNNFLVGAK
jgi:hypothetical protein